MKEFANLARIVTSRTLPSIPVLELGSPNPNKEVQLVKLMAAEPNATTLQVVKALYGKAGPTNTRALHKLQSRVMAKLLNHLYFLDHSDERLLVSRRYELECLELLHKVTVLYAEREYTLSERLLKRCLRLAQQGEFTQQALQSARLLRSLYAEQHKHKRYQAVTKLLGQLQQLYTLEEEAEQLYSDTLLALSQNVTTRRAVLSALPGHLARLEALHRKARSFTTFNILYRLRVAHEELLGHYQELISITTQAARQLRDGKINARRFDKRFNHFMSIYAHLRSRQPVAGLKLADLYTRDFHPSSTNWLYFQEHHLLLALHAQEYKKAQELLTVALKSPAYSKQREEAKQRWELYQAYTEYVLPPQRTSLARRRQLAQWVMALPETSRDKRGHNVAILVWQLLYFLRERNLEAVMTRLERLRKYQQRHLRDRHTLRSRLFLRLLTIVVEKDFDPVRSAERGQALLLDLQQTMPPGEAYAEVEIIPYEHLWGLVLNVLREGPPIATVAA